MVKNEGYRYVVNEGLISNRYVEGDADTLKKYKRNMFYINHEYKLVYKTGMGNSPKTLNEIEFFISEEY